MPRKPAAETRQHILATGRSLMTKGGYTFVGLAELVAAANVPKGSFYYYFKSKEAFGEALLREYFDDYLERIEPILSRKTTGANRLVDYFKHWVVTQSGDQFENKCLVVKLGPEVCDLSEDMRSILEAGTCRIRARLVECIEQGKSDGSITTKMSSTMLADSLYQSWLGASLMSKIGDAKSFKTAMELTKSMLT